MTPPRDGLSKTPKRGWSRTAVVITSIWVLVFAAAFVLASVYTDDDPKTDEASGFGALAGIVGILLTVLYLAVSRIRTSAQVADVLGAIGLFVAGAALSAAIGAPDAGVLLGGAAAGVFVWMRHRRRPHMPVPPPAPGRRCPHCQELFRCDLIRCPHCLAESQPWVWHSNAWWAQSRTGTWQWLDEAAGTWRWYEDGTPSTSSWTSEATAGGRASSTPDADGATADA